MSESRTLSFPVRNAAKLAMRPPVRAEIQVRSGGEAPVRLVDGQDDEVVGARGPGRAERVVETGDGRRRVRHADRVEPAQQGGEIARRRRRWPADGSGGLRGEGVDGNACSGCAPGCTGRSPTTGRPTPARLLCQPSISSCTKVSFTPSLARTCSSLRYLAGKPRVDRSARIPRGRPARSGPGSAPGGIRRAPFPGSSSLPGPVPAPCGTRAIFFRCASSIGRDSTRGRLLRDAGHLVVRPRLQCASRSSRLPSPGSPDLRYARPRAYQASALSRLALTTSGSDAMASV